MSSGIGSLNSKLGTNTSNSSSSDSIHTKTHDKSRTNIPTNTNTNSPKPSSIPTSEINRSATLLKQKLEAEENLFKKLISELQSQRDDDNLKFACLLIFNRLENLQKHRRLKKRDLVEFYQLISIRFVIKLLKYGDGENEQSKQNNNNIQSSEVKIEPKDEKSGSSKTEKEENNNDNDLSDFVMLAIQILRNIFNLQMTRESFMEHFDIKLLSREDKNLLVRKYPEIFMDRLDYLSKKNRPFDVVYYLHSNYVLEDTVAENFSEKGLPNGFGDID